ncbi:MAG: putative membrane protein YecN with MAPEG domain [Paracoccaceae bacterium]|jgi:uncharacterized membrane protein YecN with MAPEG domain
MTITPALAAVSLYAGLNMLLLIVLSGMIVRLRVSLKVSIGDGGHPALALAIRAHGNATETIPITLLLILIVALAGAPAMAVHALGLALTVGRGLHAWHFSHVGAPQWQRGAGMITTYLVQIAAALGLIAHTMGAL